jgi:hypothetical protein
MTAGYAQNKDLRAMMPYGIAFHHAALTEEERAIVEAGSSHVQPSQEPRCNAFFSLF